MSERFIVSVSGGKDSTALYLWAMERWGAAGFEAVMADTGHEHPVTLNYVRELPALTGGPAVTIVTADLSGKVTAKGKEASGNPFLDLCLWKGRVPSTKAQFCTEWLKLWPMKEWLDRTADDREPVKLVGIRRGESERRQGRQEHEWDTYMDCPLWLPLVAWSEEQVWAMLERHGVMPNPLYAEGFGRVGCFPCINAGKRELSRLPEWAWAKIAAWEAQIGQSWFPAGMIPGAHIPTVEQVKTWSVTTRGGYQLDMFPPEVAEVTSCMSGWGMCE